MKNLEIQGDIIEHLKQVNLNLPLLHVIKQILAYAKVMKVLCTIKKKRYFKKTTFLAKQVIVVIVQKIQPKYKDPSCPTISCQIGTYEFGQALLEFGSSASHMA